MAGKKLKVDLPNSDKGTVIEVPGLGLFENGKTHTLTDEQVSTWEALNGTSLPDSVDAQKMFVDAPQEEVPSPVEPTPGEGDK